MAINLRRYKKEVMSEAMYVIAAAERTFFVFLSSPSVITPDSPSIFKARLDASISTGTVMSAKSVDREYKAIPIAMIISPVCDLLAQNVKKTPIIATGTASREPIFVTGTRTDLSISKNEPLCF